MNALPLLRAQAWKLLYGLRFRFMVGGARRGTVVAGLVLTLALVFNLLWAPEIQNALERHFPIDKQIDALRLLFLTLGGALVTASAIVSSLLLFAIQVNVERMPHGLFKRLSSDWRLLGAFGLTFVVALCVTGLSLIPDANWATVSASLAFWGTFLVLALFLYGYRRALLLVNPLRQLKFLADDASRDLRAWEIRASRFAPLFPHPEGSPLPGDAPKPDYQRLAFFQANPGWSNHATKAVTYATAFARRYAQLGDHEVSVAALGAIVSINAEYVRVKEKTFFSNYLLVDNPLVTDEFINETLEQLRQTARIGISRGDEDQIEEVLRAMAALVHVYLAIDYASNRASKTHSHLAAGYLASEVERVIPHKLPDVLMEGLRMLGQSGEALLAAEGPSAIRMTVQKIGIVSCAGALIEEYRPATMTGVEQLSRLSFDLLRTKSDEIGHAAKEIRGSMAMIAKLFLTVPDSPLSSTHSTYLGPYYSATSIDALSAKLTQMTNLVWNANSDDADAKRIVDNFVQWADGIYESEKEVFLEALAKRSYFTFDVIHWISHVTKLLLALSKAEVCSERARGRLMHHATWLVSVLSFVPDDEATVSFVEHFRLTETLFETATNAQNRECWEVAETIGSLLLSWMFKAGRYETGWSTLEYAVFGMTILALNSDEEAISKLKLDVAKRIEEGGLPDKKVRDRAACEVRGVAQSLWREGHRGSSIESALAEADHGRLQPLLEEIADLISPETSGQAVRHGMFG